MESVTGCHIVAVAFPGRGHINALMSFCKVLARKRPDSLIHFVVTEDWLGFVGSDPKPPNFHFSSVPNVIPTELLPTADSVGFIDAVLTKMEAPFEQLLDRFELPPTLILADTILFWAVVLGNRRNIPVASFFPMSCTVFSVFLHLDLLEKNGHFPADLSERGDERVDYIPGVTPVRLIDLPPIIFWNNRYKLDRTIEIFSWVRKAQFLLFASVYELESQVINALKASLPFPIYTVGPAIPYFNPGDASSSSSSDNEISYWQWLDCQPLNSVLYVSLGSHLSVSDAQMNEMAAGLRDSGVRFLWVVRGENSRLKEASGDMGLLVPWCDQLRVLCHSSIGGFWTHCGWNSVQEGIFAGKPFLTFPIIADQITQSKLIAEDWKIGWRLTETSAAEILVTREEISATVKKFMDLEREEVKEMRSRARELQEACQRAIEKDGTSENDINAFVRNLPGAALGDNYI